MSNIEQKNYISNVEVLREEALATQYYHYDDHPKRSQPEDIWRGTWGGLRSDILPHIKGALPDYHKEVTEGFLSKIVEVKTAQGYILDSYFKFSSSRDSSPSGEDITQISQYYTYVGLLNLTPDSKDQLELFDPSGTFFDVHRPFEKSNLSHFNSNIVVEPEYNKLTIFDSSEFIRWKSSFGDSVETGELCLVMLLKIL